MQKIRAFDPIRSCLCRLIRYVKNDIPFSQCQSALVVHTLVSRVGNEQQIWLVARSRSWHILELQGGRNKSKHLVFSSLEVNVMNRPTVPFVPQNEQSCSHNRNIVMVAGFSTSGRSPWNELAWSEPLSAPAGKAPAKVRKNE